jgi:hypothetical protein
MTFRSGGPNEAHAKQSISRGRNSAGAADKTSDFANKFSLLLWLLPMDTVTTAVSTGDREAAGSFHASTAAKMQVKK